MQDSQALTLVEFKDELRLQLSQLLETLSEREQMLMQRVLQAVREGNGGLAAAVGDSSGNWLLPLPPGAPPMMADEGRNSRITNDSSNSLSPYQGASSNVRTLSKGAQPAPGWELPPKETTVQSGQRRYASNRAQDQRNMRNRPPWDASTDRYAAYEAQTVRIGSKTGRGMFAQKQRAFPAGDIEAPGLPDVMRAKRKNTMLRAASRSFDVDSEDPNSRSAWRPSGRPKGQQAGNARNSKQPNFAKPKTSQISTVTAIEELCSDDDEEVIQTEESPHFEEKATLCVCGYVFESKASFCLMCGARRRICKFPRDGSPNSNNKQGTGMMGNRAPPPLPPLPNSANQLPGSSEGELTATSADHAAGRQQAGDCAAGDLGAGDRAGGDRAAGVVSTPPGKPATKALGARYDSDVEEIAYMKEQEELGMADSSTSASLQGNLHHESNRVVGWSDKKSPGQKEPKRVTISDDTRIMTSTRTDNEESGQDDLEQNLWLKHKSIFDHHGTIMDRTPSEKRNKPSQFITTIRQIVASDYFDYCVGLLLMANAICIGWQVDYSSRHLHKATPTYFLVMEAIFCGCFVVEIVLRLIIYRTYFFCMNGWQWNIFDFVVVVLQLAEAFTSFILQRSGNEAPSAFEGVGLLRTLRLGRVIRLVRMVRLIPELKSMVYLISASMWSFFWTIMLLLLLMYGVAVYFTDIVTAYRRENQDKVQVVAALDDSWGTVMDAILSLYQAILGGVDWKDLMDPLMDEVSGISVFVFSVYIAFTTLVMLNLVTGVFVEGAQRIIREDKDSELVKQVRKMFAMSDTDEDREVTWQEFESMMDDSKLDQYFQAVDLSRQEAKDLFRLLDNDASGALSAEEFVQGCLRLRGPARSVDLATLIYNYKNNARWLMEHLASIDESFQHLNDNILKMVPAS